MNNLNIKKGSPPVRQKCRAYTAERYEAILVEIKTLKDMNYIREVQYPEWLANVVIVWKKNG